MSEDSSDEPTTESSETSWYNQPFVIAIAVFLGLLTAGLLISANINQAPDVNTDQSNNTSNTESSTETGEPELIENTSSAEPRNPLAFSEYEPIFCDPGASHEEREQYVEENLEGERVTWEGVVFETETISDHYVIVKLCNKDDLEIESYSIRVRVGADEEDTLIDLERGDNVSFNATIDRYRVSNTQIMADGTITDHTPT